MKGRVLVNEVMRVSFVRSFARLELIGMSRKPGMVISQGPLLPFMHPSIPARDANLLFPCTTCLGLQLLLPFYQFVFVARSIYFALLIHICFVQSRFCFADVNLVFFRMHACAARCILYVVVCFFSLSSVAVVNTVQRRRPGDLLQGS